MHSRKSRPQSHRDRIENLRDQENDNEEDPGALSDDTLDYSSRSRLSPLDGPSGRRLRGHRRQASYNAQQWDSILSSADAARGSVPAAVIVSSPLSKSSGAIGGRSSEDKEEEESHFFKRKWHFLPKVSTIDPEGPTGGSSITAATLSPLTLIRRDLSTGGLGETGSPFDCHDIGKIWGD